MGEYTLIFCIVSMLVALGSMKAHADNENERTNYRCKNETDCSLYGLRGHYHCDGEFCRCNPGAKHLESAYACHMSLGLGKNCTIDLDCKVTRSACAPEQDCALKHSQDCGASSYFRCPCKRQCQCEPGYDFLDNRCVKKCTDDSRCSQNERCADGRCECRKYHNYDILEKQCTPVRCESVCDCPKYEDTNSRSMFRCQDKYCVISLEPNLEADKGACINDIINRDGDERVIGNSGTDDSRNGASKIFHAYVLLMSVSFALCKSA